MIHNNKLVSDQILDEASRHVARLDRGLSDAERSELDEFLRKPDARRAFLELAALSDRLNALSDLAPPVDVLPVRPSGSRLAYGLAAGFLLFIAVSLAYVAGVMTPTAPQAPEQRLVTYETRIGEQSIVSLSDGSELALNTDSQIRVAFSESGRLAILDRGEVHFDVAADAYRPFSVRSGNHVVQVVGTSFTVYRSGEHSVEVIVREGTVRVAASRNAEQSQDIVEPPTLLADGDKLTAGEIGVFRDDGGSVTTLDEFTLDARLSWREGKLVFSGESLEEALGDISRYTPMRFEFLDDQAKAIQIAGVFRSGDIDGLLQTLAANFDIAYQRLDDDLILISTR